MTSSSFIPGNCVANRISRCRNVVFIRSMAVHKTRVNRLFRHELKAAVKNFVHDADLWYDESFSFSRQTRLTSWELY